MHSSNLTYTSGILIVLTLSCNSSTISKFDKEFKNENEIISAKEDFSNDVDYAKIAANFAEKFNPTPTSDREVQSLVNVPDSVSKAYKYLRNNSFQKSEVLLTIIFLKLYRSHLECCHQSYESRTNIPHTGNIDSIADPLLYEYNLIINFFDNSRQIEFINSGIAHSWAEKNRNLLENKIVKKEFEEIERISKNIEKGVYWE